MLEILLIIFLIISIFVSGYLYQFLKKGIQFFDYASQYILHDAEKENAKNEK